MVKKLFSSLIIIICMVLIFITLGRKKPTPLYLKPQDKIVKKEVPETNNEIVDYINKQNSKIKSMSVYDMPIKLQQKNGIIIRANGFLAIEKDKNFRLIVNHFLTGREIDIGSNQEYFWFWSKRMVPQALYYAFHEDLNKTLLKTVFNPEWMLDSLNLNTIKKPYEIGITNGNYAIIQDRKNIYNESVRIITLINPNEKLVIGRYLYQNNILLASTEYHDFKSGFAKRMTVNWYEESIFMEWDLSNAKYNVEINSTVWKAPNYKNKINMAD